MLARDRPDRFAVQSSHSGNPLRIGGVAVLIGLSVAILLRIFVDGFTFAVSLLVSALPIFFAGFSEDLGVPVSPMGRFIAAICSALAVVALLGLWAPRADIPGLDWAMTYPVVAIAITVILTAGFCHAVNLIDGMNGLAASVIITSAIGAAMVATLAREHDIAFAALLLASATLGFLLVNWPIARVFLGDAGAYGIGHILIWLLIILAWRSEEVAIPALLLIMFWPIADVLHTMARRLLRRKSILRPDRMHMHQKIRRALDIILFGYRGRQRSNPLTTLIMLPFILLPVATGVRLWDQPEAAWLALSVFFALFSALHPLIVTLTRKLSPAALAR